MLSQTFLSYVHQSMGLVHKFPRVNWGHLLGSYFLNEHRELMHDDIDAYAALFQQGFDEVKRLTGVEMEDLSLPF